MSFATHEDAAPPGPTPEQIRRFRTDGFLVVDRFVTAELTRAIAERFPCIFRGEFETTVPPDEWRWVEGRDPVDVTRMIWNGWKCDRTVARLALSGLVGRWCAELAGWDGTRLNQDGCLWKPPGAAGLSFHQDGNYNAWVDPLDLMTCWVPLDDVGAESGTLEYALGSHIWGPGDRPQDFHDPGDYRECVVRAAKAGGHVLDVRTVTIPAGGAAFHHVWLWHGSGPNRTPADRRVVALHCMPAAARFHPTNPAYAQGRYKRFGDTAMDESFYPVMWRADGYRSPFIEEYLAAGTREYRSHAWRREEQAL